MNRRGPLPLIAAGVLSILGLHLPATAANFPLQIILPRAGNTAPDPGGPTLSSDHFSLWAYPGIPYRVRAAVIGGDYPYTFSLSGAPNGMTVDSHGVIQWTNPQASAPSVTLIVTDASGVQAQTTWSVTVDATKFRFLNCDAASGGNGSFATPWRNLEDLPMGIGTDTVGRILYFRGCSASGHYNALNPAFRPSNGTDRKDLRSDLISQQWLAYPGERPIFDVGYNPNGDQGVYIRFQRQPAALVGFESINGHNKQWNTIPDVNYGTFWDNYMHGLAGLDGSNSAFIMTESGANLSQASYMVIQNNEMADWGHRLGGNAGSCMKIYSHYKLLIEDNLCRDAVGSAEIEGIALKGGTMDRITVRGNTIHDVAEHPIGGNNHTLMNSEILYNLVYNATIALNLNQDSLITTPIYVYRNTFIGRIEIDNVSSGSGPFVLTENVIVSNDPVGGCVPGSRINCFPQADASRIQLTNNLEGSVADGITTAVGLLAPAYAQYLGTRGFQLGAGAPPVNRCDLNGNGVAVTDVQMSVNQAIGMTACTDGDINSDLICNVLDVQRVVNAALGGSCVTQ